MAGTGKFSNEGGKALLNAFFRQTSLPTTLYLLLSGLSITDSTTMADIMGNGSNTKPQYEPETSSGGYERQELSTTLFTAATVENNVCKIKNGATGAEIVFTFNHESENFVVQSMAVTDTQIGGTDAFTGNIYSYSNLSSTKTTNNGETLTIGQNNFVQTID
jgi:hypothetical protein